MLSSRPDILKHSAAATGADGPDGIPALKLHSSTLQRPLARMFQTAFLPVLWACIFSGQRGASHTWQEVYKWTLRVRPQYTCNLCICTNIEVAPCNCCRDALSETVCKAPKLFARLRIPGAVLHPSCALPILAAPYATAFT